MPYQQNTPRQAADQGVNPNLMAWLRLARAGLATFPAGPDKRPLLRDWQGKASTETAQIRRWATRWPDAIPALPTGTMNGVSVLDLDVREDGRDGIKAAAADLGLDVSRTFTVRTPSGGRHAYYRHRDGVTNAASHLPAGVDVRGEGGFVIAPGAALPDGRSYRISGEADLADLELLRRWPAVLMPPPRVEREDTPRDRDHLSADDLRAILAELAEAPRMTNGDRPWIEDRSGNVKVGMALHHWSGGSAEGLALWQEHAEQSTRYKGARNLRQQWESFRDKPDGVTMGSLIIAAPEWCEARHAAEIDAMFLDDPDGEDDVAEDAARAKPGAGLLTFTAPADLSLKTARRPIIKGLIAAGDVGCIVGAPGVGKSLIAPICEPCAADQEARKPKLSKNERAALTELRNIAESDGTASFNAWRELCVVGSDVFTASSSAARRARFAEALKALAAKDRISIADDVVQVLGFGAVTAADFEDDSDE